MRNYLTFGRCIPIKSNLAYELYQSQCLTPDGLLERDTFYMHPYTTANHERREYCKLGESAYLDHKQEEFRESAQAGSWDFARRAGNSRRAEALRHVRRRQRHRVGHFRRPRFTHHADG